MNVGPMELIENTRVLVAMLGDDPDTQALVAKDAGIYQKHFPHTQAGAFASGRALCDQLVSGGWDIVHVFADYELSGAMDDASMGEMMSACTGGNVKQLWLAGNTDPDIYIAHAKGGPFNLLMTVDRNGGHFFTFLDNLLGLMVAGNSLPLAWVELVPQTEHAPQHETAPVCIVMPGRGQAVFQP